MKAARTVLRHTAPFVFVAASVIATRPAEAATRTWTGGSSASWSDGANWGGAPIVAGDDLVFPAGALDVATMNDLPPGMTFNTIAVSGDGYTLAGNAIRLGGATFTSATTGAIVTLPIALSASAVFSASGAAVSFQAPGAIDLGVFTLTAAGDATLVIASPISGDGALVRSGGVGIVDLRGDNTYTGTTTVSSGELRIRTASGLGSPARGTVVDGSGSLVVMGVNVTVAEPVTLDSTAFASLVSLLGPNTWTGSITVQRDSQIGAASSLLLSGDISGPGGIYTSGKLSFTGNNTYVGGTTIRSKSLTVASPSSLGSGPVVTWLASTLVVGNGTYTNALTLAGSTYPTGALKTLVGQTVWAGPISVTSPDSAIDVAGVLLATGVVDGVGGLTLRGAGTMKLSSASSYEGATIVSSGTLICSGGAAIPNASVVTADGTLRLESSERIGPLSGGGNVIVDPATVLTTGGNATVYFQGAITGAGAVTFVGPGQQWLTGPNTYDGETILTGGTLSVTGSIASTSTVTGGATLGVGQNGSVGIVVSSGATIFPGFTEPRVGASRSLTLDATSTFRVRLDAIDAGSFSQLSVTGGVALGGATLAVDFDFAPAVGDTFVIVDNDGVDPVLGTFAGRPEGSLFFVSGVPLRITYSGGTGNDVVLRVTTPPEEDAGTDAGIIEPDDGGGDAAIEDGGAYNDADATMPDAGGRSAIDSDDADLLPVFQSAGSGCACGSSGHHETSELWLGFGFGVGLLFLRRRTRSRE